MGNRTKSSSFHDYLLESLSEDDDAVFMYIKEALEKPDLSEKKDYLFLLKAIRDVATARGKSEIAEQAGISRQGLHKILEGESIPSIQNISAILNAIGLRFSVEQIGAAVEEELPARVLDVAEYAADRISRSSTYMKLQKIVYYAQVESLVRSSRPLFSEKIVAWRGGPVVRELFEKHRGMRYLGEKSLGDASALSAAQKACVDRAIQKYGALDGDSLSHLTHLEEPWQKARRGVPESAPSGKEITHQSIISYYSSLPNYVELDAQDEAAD